MNWAVFFDSLCLCVWFPNQTFRVQHSKRLTGETGPTGPMGLNLQSAEHWASPCWWDHDVMLLNGQDQVFTHKGSFHSGSISVSPRYYQSRCKETFRCMKALTCWFSRSYTSRGGDLDESQTCFLIGCFLDGLHLFLGSFSCVFSPGCLTASLHTYS